MSEEVRRWWNETAEYFQDGAEIPVGIHYGPGAPDDDDLGLLGDLAGADVIELGCGGGQCSVGLARRGATVLGVDVSDAQLAYARRLLEDHGVEDAVDLLYGDVTDLKAVKSACMDVAFSAYAFQWVGDLAACFGEAHRVLRPGGRFVFSLPHPFYELLDPETGGIDRSYFETGRRVATHEGIEAEEVTYTRTVGDIHTALVEAGFQVQRLLEPGSSDPDDYEELWEFRPELMAKVPPTLVVRATKPGG